MVYQVFYWIHVVSYIAWLAAFAGSMIFAYKVGKAYKTPDEKRFMKLERRTTSIGAHLGALGILISGGALASVPGGPQWGWFNFMLYPWLALKQLIFILILVLVVFSIKRSITFKKMLKNEDSDPLIDATRRAWKRAYNMSLVVYVLVVVNTILGLAKPF